MSQKSSDILKSLLNKDLFVLPSIGGNVGVSTFGVGISTLSKKWVGGVLGPDNTIYCIPHNAPNMLLINTENETITTQNISGGLGPTNVNALAKWAGGVLNPVVPDSRLNPGPVVTAVNCAYSESPLGFTIKPDLNISTYSKVVYGQGSVIPTSNTWFGGVLAPNRRVYGIPFDARFVLVGSGTTFGSLPSDAGKWVGGVLASNGRIYGIPHNSTTVLEINPSVNTVTTFGSLAGSGKWSGGVLAPNGKIYGIPFSSSSILEIDPSTQSATTFGSVGVSGGKWAGGVLAPNGMIYGIPFNSSTILEINPITQTATTFGSVGIGTQKWFGGVLAPNGNIYGIPHDSTSVLSIGTTSTTEPAEWLLSTYCNKF